ncbi:MAG: sodium/solute symporter [Bacteroidaceae bacterium]|nr:sodium/solute symporter [Bacteroidaceae bacterium]
MDIQLQTLDWGILIGYFVILIGIGIWASSKRKKGSSLFLAERSLRWPHIGFSMWGTNVGPSMLIASASAGYLSGVGSGNYAWYAFILIALLTFVFIPKYLGSNISTLPEFMGKRFGERTRNILAWYTIVTVVISWLALQLFAGGKLLEQFFNIPIWLSALILLCLSAFISMLGGLKALAYTNIYQMILLIVVSASLTVVGINRVGGIEALYNGVPEEFWHLWRSNDDPMYPAIPLFLGYLVSGVWFWCTDQSMVQPVLAARSIEEGQKGTNFTGWLKILDVFLYILPGIICYVMSKQGIIGGNGAPELADKAYMTLVMHLFPIGMVGLIFAILTAALVSTIGSALNALSTVFTMDIYAKAHPEAKGEQIVKTGRIVTVVGGLISIAITIAIYNIKGLDFFNIFQSVLGFIAPPMAAVFLMGVFWKRTSTSAANFALTFGTVMSIGTGVLYLWVLTPDQGYTFWPHFMLLSFYLCLIIMACMVVISFIDARSVRLSIDYGNVAYRPSRTVIVLWLLLVAVMVFLYWFFN